MTENPEKQSREQQEKLHCPMLVLPISNARSRLMIRFVARFLVELLYSFIRNRKTIDVGRIGKEERERKPLMIVENE